MNKIVRTLFTPSRILISSKKLRNCGLTYSRKMVVFTQKINGVTGCTEWDVQDDNYDYHQEIARSSFADMLHDTERNKKYFLALKSAIDKMHASGKPANVLDIGTGTGLLSMMAAQCGADSIVACEGFLPMAECAVQIINENGFSNKITVIPKRSTDLIVGKDGDLKMRANILVTEVFDTELIGEGAIETFSHAHSVLLEKDCIVVPESGTIYAQVVECPTLNRWNKLIDVADDEGQILIKTPSEMKICNGSAAVHDIQLSQLPLTMFKEIVKPIAVLQYDWSGKSPIKKNLVCTHQAKAQITGNAQMVFMWWDLKMDTEDKILLSCAPWWQHPDADRTSVYPQDSIPWRDHWMQAVYYFPNEVSVKEGDDISLTASQDEYSLWFNLDKGIKDLSIDFRRPICECGVHMTYSRTHVAYMNDGSRNKKFLRVLEENVNENSICLCLNGASLMGLAAAKLGAKKVIYIESGIIAKRILNSYISFNSLSNSVEIFPDIEALLHSYPNCDITMIFGDPNFNSAILPWDNLRLGHVVAKLMPSIKDIQVFPKGCSLWTMAVEFLDLHKIKAPLNICENIDLRKFDELIQNSRSRSDEEIEPQPLWEYPCLSRTKPIKIMDLNLNNEQELKKISQGAELCESEGIYNGFVFWLEWDLNGDPKNRISSGPLQPTDKNERVTWDPYTRQGVKLMESNISIHPEELLKYNVECNLSDGRVDINVVIEK